MSIGGTHKNPMGGNPDRTGDRPPESQKSPYPKKTAPKKMTEIEAGSEIIRLQRGDIIEAMVDEGLDVEIANRVFANLTKRYYAIQAKAAEFTLACREQELTHIVGRIARTPDGKLWDLCPDVGWQGAIPRDYKG